LSGFWLFFAISFGSNLALSVLFFTLVSAAYYAFHPAFWSVPTEFLSESAAAASIGLINAIGNLGGLIGPFVLGILATRTHSFTGGLSFLVGSFLLSGILMLAVGTGRRKMAPAIAAAPAAGVSESPAQG